VDLFFGFPCFHSYSVSLGLDLGSDHTPLLLQHTLQRPPRLQTRSRWFLPRNFGAVEWGDWRATLARKSIPRGDTPQESYQVFSRVLRQHSEDHFKLWQSSRPHRPGCPRWTASCTRAVYTRRRVRKLFYRHLTPANRTTYSTRSQEAKTAVELAKKNLGRVSFPKLAPGLLLPRSGECFRRYRVVCPFRRSH
jgi:hypothetical protein